MRIMLGSNAPWVASGYGTQTAGVLKAWQDLGHDVACFATYGLGGGRIDVNGVPIYPRAHDAWGQDLIGGHLTDFEADLYVTLMDNWVFPADYHESVPVPWLSWFPIDTEPARVAAVKASGRADYNATFSRHGVRILADAGITAEYLPLGIDVDTFTPGDQAEAREYLHFPQDAVIVAMVAANLSYPARKAFPENLAAFAQFRKCHPEALLYLHTELRPSSGGNSIDLYELMESVGIPDDAVIRPNQYMYIAGSLDDGHMAQVYRGADVLLAAASNEGFGLPIAEAQACGCPVIVTDFTSMPEVAAGNGILVPGRERRYARMGAWDVVPDVGGIVEALEEVAGWDYSTREDRADQGIAHVWREYSWPVVADNYWRPLLERIEEDVTVAKLKKKQALRLPVEV
jgi:glycosyltransferase involved in cell wall biosynthesis